MSSEVNAFLMGSSAPAAKFLELGAVHEGRITHLEMRQMRDIKTNEPLFWPDGKPKEQAVITIATEERDAAIENDNGLRRLFVGTKGMKQAITAAIKKAGADGLAIGGTLGVKYVRDGEQTQRGFNPPKVYGAKYDPPAPGFEFDEPPAEDYGEFDDAPF